MGRSGRGPGTPYLSQEVSPALRSRGLMQGLFVWGCLGVILHQCRAGKEREREREREREFITERERELMGRRVLGGSLCSRKGGGRRPRFIGIR
jgi:hypothetical protein